jgi:hypothetical protein
MQEVCYCGRSGDIEQRNHVIDGDGREALECPECGHLDHLSWLPEDTRARLFAETKRLAQERRAPAA